MKFEVIVMSATCSQMDCSVSWNSAEKSWDFPCHDGRFDHKGEVINAPLVRHLKTVKS